MPYKDPERTLERARERYAENPRTREMALARSRRQRMKIKAARTQGQAELFDVAVETACILLGGSERQ